MSAQSALDDEALFVSNINFVEMINNVCASGFAPLIVCFWRLAGLERGWWLGGWIFFFELMGPCDSMDLLRGHAAVLVCKWLHGNPLNLCSCLRCRTLTQPGPREYINNSKARPWAIWRHCLAATGPLVWVETDQEVDFS